MVCSFAVLIMTSHVYAATKTVFKSCFQGQSCPSKIDLSDIREPSFASPDELERALRYDLIELAPAFVEAEKKYSVNAICLAAIAAFESGWGRYQFEDNNILGFGSKDFDDEEECIMYVARFLAENYMSEDGQYFGGGYGLEHINIRWNGGQHWLKEVSEIAFDILERINGTGV